MGGLRMIEQTPSLSPLGRFIDTLLQSFEDRRLGLKDQALTAEAAEPFFASIHDQEGSRLRAALREADPHLSEEDRTALQTEVDEFVRRVLVPGYARLAAPFTGRERNDFFLARGATRAFERIACVGGGTLVGVLVVWAPFIPLWSKEWIWLFAIAGLFVPETRRYLAFRRYGREVNELSARSARELERLREAYLLREEKIDGPHSR